MHTHEFLRKFANTPIKQRTPEICELYDEILALSMKHREYRANLAKLIQKTEKLMLIENNNFKLPLEKSRKLS